MNQMKLINSIINNMKIKERKSEGRFEGRISVNGKRKSFYGKSNAEVKNKAKEYLMSVENGFTEGKKVLFNDYVEYWLKTYKKDRIQPSSYTKLQRVYRRQIKDSIGKKYIADITTRDIQNLIDIYANPPKNSDIRPLALSGLKRIIHLIKPCLRKAVEEGLVSKNVCEGVILPIEESLQVETKHQFSLSDNDIEDFKQVALEKYDSGIYKSRDALVLLIILNLGLRRGEMLALDWSDIDVENKILHINKTIQSDVYDYENKTVKEILKKGTKTSAGCRVLPLNDTTIYYFNELKEYDRKMGIETPFVCATRANTRQTGRNLTRSLKRLRKRTNIINKNEISLHTLRHTFGSTLIRRGVSIEVVSKLMGHANIMITYNKYIHVLQEEQAKVMNMISIC